jgi:mono/diheme cytochrome c family protein
MAATDKSYRSQYRLDIVFALTSVAMLLSIVWMFADDYFRPFKVEQRTFREVESAMAQRAAVDLIPNKEDFDKAKEKFDDAQAKYKNDLKELGELKDYVADKQPKLERAEAAFQAAKADFESRNSFLNIANEENKRKLIELYEKELNTLGTQLNEAKADRDKFLQEIKLKQARIDQIEGPFTEAQSEWKRISDKFDVQIKAAYYKQWGWGDRIRALPIIDGFASPVKIQQYTNNDIPIDYNFKYVTRFDRCTTCHLGIDRPNYTKDALRALTKDPTPEQDEKLKGARKLLDERTEAYDKAFAERDMRNAPGASDRSRLPNSSQLTLAKVDPSVLTEARINQYSAHPRLDLFVGANSKHPAEKFGCTACHYGQGSATDFTLAAHTPNSAKQKQAWIKEHDWEAQHMWDFPMRPQRFIESSCIKCHHEVTDLVSSDNRVEAPKLLRGYNLIKDNGCFGCHEIAGIKGGRAVGPDLRLEPSPPLADLSPLERTKLESDPENPPGRLQKVGPSLFRLREKTNPQFVAKWIRSPRGFRPTTKMPHFYGTSNNHPDVLPDDQKAFPDAEIQAITYYLFQESDKYLRDIVEMQESDKKNPAARTQDEKRLSVLLTKGKDKLTKEEGEELAKVRGRLEVRKEKVLVDRAPGHKGDAAKGRQLFTEKGCLACHSHQGTTKPAAGTPAVKSEAQYGPDLSQVIAKLGKAPGDKPSARVWLIQWILDPHVYNARSRMPITHLTENEAADVAAWLLDQQPTELGAEWADLSVPEPEQKKLEDLARVYLTRLVAKSDIDTLFTTHKLEQAIVNLLPGPEKDFIDAYENKQLDSLKYYLGKKAVGRLGCYACHDIPGMDNMKPIGTTLNDWGKKATDRLAFENINNFVERNFRRVKAWHDDKGNLQMPEIAKEDGKEVKKMPYEAFFYDDLLHHGRSGFLHQKLLDPRSYDYTRKLAWDDRSRMPQFRFARAHPNADEDPAVFEARAWHEEAEAREAVMTFILGLTAEQVPLKMINQPTGDRLAEVKGRQVIETHNCNGCHQVRPGAYDFQLTPETVESLRAAYKNADIATRSGAMHSFPMHHLWTGKNPPPGDRVVAAGVQARMVLPDQDDDEPASPRLWVKLAEALRFVDPDARQKGPLDIPASSTVKIPLAALSPELKDAKTQSEVDRVLAPKSPFGGAFADLLVPYLIAKDPNRYKPYKPNPALIDSAEARGSLPPALFGEGERVQPQWLYQFLLNPTKVREMSILRMPKFHLSQHEAKTLIDYFAAVERISNPGMGLTYPGEEIPQQAALDAQWWRDKNEEYLHRLKLRGPRLDKLEKLNEQLKQAKQAKDKAEQQKLEQEIKQVEAEADTRWYTLRLGKYQDAWDEAAKLAREEMKPVITRGEKKLADYDEQIGKLKEQLKKTKDKDEQKKVEQEITTVQASRDTLDGQLKPMKQAFKDVSAEEFQKQWCDNQAYAADAYRMIVNKQMCLQCHQVGPYKSSDEKGVQGPALALAHQRLRPEWTFRWIATPQRHVMYPSLMPVNFKRDVREFQDTLAGDSLQQIEAVRDVLMDFPRIMALPVNQQWNPILQAAPPPAGDKKP